MSLFFPRRIGGFLLFLLLALTLPQPGPASAAEAPANGQSQTAGSSAKPASSRTASDGAAPQAEANTEGDEEDNVEESARTDAWEAMWLGQKEMLNEMRETAFRLSGEFAEQTESLSRYLQPFEQEGRRLLVFVNTFKGHPNPLEAVRRRIGVTIDGLNQILQPVTMSWREAQGLLDRVNRMAASLPEETAQSKLSPEMKEYISDITKARLRLTAVLAQYDSLLPSMKLLRQLEETRKSIAAELPELWKDYYLQGPIPWLSSDNWSNLPTNLSYAWQAMRLRLPVEMPSIVSNWSAAVIRFVISLLFTGSLAVIARRRWLKNDASESEKRIFRFCLPMFVFGFSFLGASLSASGDFYRLFLLLGSLCLIHGEIWLAWDLRRRQYPGQPVVRPPFRHFMPLAIAIYAILYIPLTQELALICWLLAIIAALLRWRKVKRPVLTSIQLENGALDCYPIVLWICLFLGVSGFQKISMLVYLAFVALCVALELSMAGMSLVGSVNEHLPKEGARAVLARLLLALAAPCVLVLSVAGICLWAAMLPGGVYLIGQYALRGVTVGATQFNIIQILVIISAFYLTRTVVSMGTRFLAKLPGEGVRIDPTLVTPMQTALTYMTWAIFGLFALHAFGMSLSNLAMVAGGLSVGIGFGMQTIVNNFLSGLILIFGRTLQVGDIVEVGGVTGRVRKISVRATMVETFDNAMIYVPNSEFMSGRLINWTSFSRSVRREVAVGVAYGSDTAKVVKLLLDIAGAHENVLKYPKPSVVFADFAASSLDFRLRFWVRDFDQGASTASQIRLSINDVFNKENIEIAFPQLDVHIKNDQQDATGGATQGSLIRTPPPRLVRPGNKGSSLRKGRAQSGANSQNPLRKTDDSPDDKKIAGHEPAPIKPGV